MIQDRFALVDCFKKLFLQLTQHIDVLIYPDYKLRRTFMKMMHFKQPIHSQDSKFK